MNDHDDPRHGGDRGYPPAADPPRPAPPASPVRGIDLAVAIGLTVGAVLSIAMLVETPRRTVGFVLAMLSIQSVIPIVVVYVVLIHGRGVRWRDLGLVAAPRRWYWRAVLIALATLPLVAGINYLAQTLAGGDFRNPQIDVLAPEGFTWFGLAGTLVVVGLIGPTVEEIVFRGLLYGWLRGRIGAAAAAAASGLAFGAAHGIALLTPALALQGVVLALVYERSGSLWPPIIVHALFNTVMILLLYGAMATGAQP